MLSLSYSAPSSSVNETFQSCMKGHCTITRLLPSLVIPYRDYTDTTTDTTVEEIFTACGLLVTSYGLVVS